MAHLTMKYSEEFLVALAMLHGGSFWTPKNWSEECWVFMPGFNEHTPLGGGRTVDNVSVRATNRYEAALLYCERHSLLPIEVSS